MHDLLLPLILAISSCAYDVEPPSYSSRDMGGSASRRLLRKKLVLDNGVKLEQGLYDFQLREDCMVASVNGRLRCLPVERAVVMAELALDRGCRGLNSIYWSRKCQAAAKFTVLTELDETACNDSKGVYALTEVSAETPLFRLNPDKIGCDQNFIKSDQVRYYTRDNRVSDDTFVSLEQIVE
jgi:hypothetical protein